jgi:hypothetical protein
MLLMWDGIGRWTTVYDRGFDLGRLDNKTRMLILRWP